MNHIPWDVTCLTLFPNMFPGPLADSITGSALKKKIWQINSLNLRDFGDKQGRVDDSPYGGGAGMVIRAEVINSALITLENSDRPKILLSPKGTVFNQDLANKWSKKSGVVLICGRYEGVDQRIIDKHHLIEISLGDFIMSGGELPALAILDSCIRLLPNVLGNCNSLNEESFTNFLLEYPHYTRPSLWQGLKVPDILLNGSHAEINKWRQQQSEDITKLRRKDLWSRYCQQQKNKP